MWCDVACSWTKFQSQETLSWWRWTVHILTSAAHTVESSTNGRHAHVNAKGSKYLLLNFTQVNSRFFQNQSKQKHLLKFSHQCQQTMSSFARSNVTSMLEQAYIALDCAFTDIDSRQLPLTNVRPNPWSMDLAWPALVLCMQMTFYTNFKIPKTYIYVCMSCQCACIDIMHFSFCEIMLRYFYSQLYTDFQQEVVTTIDSIEVAATGVTMRSPGHRDFS